MRDGSPHQLNHHGGCNQPRVCNQLSPRSPNQVQTTTTKNLKSRRAPIASNQTNIASNQAPLETSGGHQATSATSGGHQATPTTNWGYQVMPTTNWGHQFMPATNQAHKAKTMPKQPQPATNRKQATEQPSSHNRTTINQTTKSSEQTTK